MTASLSSRSRCAEQTKAGEYQAVCCWRRSNTGRAQDLAKRLALIDLYERDALSRRKLAIRSFDGMHFHKTNPPLGLEGLEHFRKTSPPSKDIRSPHRRDHELGAFLEAGRPT